MSTAGDTSASQEPAGLKVLLLSYFFPPLASAGGHRTGALARNLTALGAEVTVVTAKYGLDVSDSELERRLPPAVRVVRVASLEGARIRARARDRYKHDDAGAARRSPAQRAAVGLAWTLTALRSFNPWAFRKLIYGLNALRACRREIRRDRPDVLLVSLGPMCQTWVAVRAARGSGVPVVFDFRDLWTAAPEYYKNFLEHRITRPVRWIDRPIERRTMRAADFFVANHEHMAQTMNALEPHTRGRTLVVPNGYDESDFAPPAQLRPPSGRGERVAVVRSMGTTYIDTVGPLVEAARRLPEASARRLTVELIGPYYDHRGDLVRPDGVQVVDVRPPVPHDQALTAMATADALLFLLRDTPGIGDMIPARLYEYLRLGRPILALAPDGAARDLVLHCGGTVVHPADVDGLAAALDSIATGGPLPGAPDPADPAVRAFDRHEQALVLGRAMRELVGGRDL